MLSFYLGLLIPALGFIVALYQIPKEMQILKKDFPNKNRWQRLNHKGKRFVVISFIAAIVVETCLIIKGPDTDKNVILRIPSKPVTIYVPTITKETKIIKEFEKGQQQVDPVMDIDWDSVRFKGTLSNIWIHVPFRTINSGIAFNPRSKILLFSLSNEKTIEHLQNVQGHNSLIKSYKINDIVTHGYDFDAQTAVPENPMAVDTTYLFFKALFSNKEVNGRDQPPLRGLFYIKVSTIPNSVSDLKIKPVIDQHKLDLLQKILIENNYW